MRIEISGHSDDCIEIEGDYTDEVSAYHKRYLLFGDGTVVSGEFDNEGVWRFLVERRGSAQAEHISFDGDPDDDSQDSATERVILTAPDVSLLLDTAEMPPWLPTSELARAGRVLWDLHDAGLLNDRKNDWSLRALTVIAESLKKQAA